ncbi:disulfide bond formation protein B [Roseibium hamelinense]|nr:disulfide bond formation protein B [Roseibium hamelinense]
MLLFTVGLAAIAIAWGYQIIGGFVPCELCLEQRVPYYVGLPLTLAGLFLSLENKLGAAALLFCAVTVIFAYGSGLGLYQAGAEWGFWLGPNGCGGSSGGPDSAADMLSALQSTRLVSCTEASWRFLGLSFAGWNAVVSGGLAVLGLVAALLLRRSGKMVAA